MKLTFSHKSHNTKHRLALPKHSFLHRIGRDFIVDWLVMLFLGVSLVVIFIGVGYIKYTSSEKIINSDTEVAMPTNIVDFNDIKLDSVLEKYNLRQKIRTALNGGQYSIPDPGL